MNRIYIMHKSIHLLFLYFLLSSCSEGDVLENNIDNFTAPIESCTNTEKNTFVLYKIDQEATRSFSLGFTSTTFTLEPDPDELSVTIELNNTTNTLVYRNFGSKINGASYFCSSVPPSGITINQEFLSTDGNAEILYTLKEETASTIIYTRKIILKDITLNGAEFSLRQEQLEFGEDEITVTK